MQVLQKHCPIKCGKCNKNLLTYNFCFQAFHEDYIVLVYTGLCIHDLGFESFVKFLQYQRHNFFISNSLIRAYKQLTYKQQY